MIPVTRIDRYLAVITNDEDAITPLPDPVTRIDHYLAQLAGLTVDALPAPQTRIDYYLAALCGMPVALPDEPVTRIDFYLAALNGETVETPEAVTRIDYYLNNWSGGGSLPWQTFVGNPLQFTAPKAHTLKSATVEFEPQQDLHGYANPWPAGGGKNILNPSSLDEVATNSRKWHSTDGGFTLKANTKYTFSVYNTTSTVAMYFYAYGGSSIETGTRTVSYTPTVDTVVYLRAYYSNGITDDMQFQLEIGDQSDKFYSYSNICPISGWTGVDAFVRGNNMWDEEWELGSLNTTTGAKSPSTTRIRTKNYIAVKPNTRYRILSDFTACVYDEGKNYIGQCPWAYTGVLGQYYLDIPTNAYYLLVAFPTSYGTTYHNDLGIMYPSTVSEYVPYNPNSQTYSVTWQDEAGTVYGGTIDLTTGVLTGTWEEKDMGALNWAFVADSNWNCFSVSVTGKKPGQNIKCSIYQRKTIYKTDNDFAIDTNANNAQVYARDTSYNGNASAFKTAMTGQRICYELATPVTYQLDPQTITALKGINTMWTDGDSLTVEARGEAVNLNALQSLNMLLGGRYTNNHTADDLTDEEALDVILGGQR